MEYDGHQCEGAGGQFVKIRLVKWKADQKKSFWEDPCICRCGVPERAPLRTGPPEYRDMEGLCKIGNLYHI